MLEINNLRFTYPNRKTAALDGINLNIKRGEFITICGPSGCGKSTLLRHLKPTLKPCGKAFGEIRLDGTDIYSLDANKECQTIGFVMQSPEDQLVCDKVWHELAFGLESLGLPCEQIRARVAETAEYFGIAEKFDADTAKLSGGQKQLVNLAAVMVMRPAILILDEPTAQLDPIAASEYLSAIGRLNRELGVTVILAEHRLEDALAICDRAVVMDSGRVIADCEPHRLGEILPQEMYGFMPIASRVWRAVSKSDGDMPLTLREGRAFISTYTEKYEPLPITTSESTFGECVMSARELFYKYEPTEKDIIKGLSLAVHRGELLAILGGNGSGKSTALSLLAGINKPQSGEISAEGRVVLLPQDPSILFCHETVRDELREISDDYKDIAGLCEIEGLLDAHPFDLSGGERQRTALAKVLLCNPDILLVDEPTKGMDNAFKIKLAEIFDELKNSGKAIIMVSHDAEFCAETADTCAMFFDGAIISTAAPAEFFRAASYYTTAAARMSRDIVDAVTVSELIKRLGGTESAAIGHKTAENFKKETKENAIEIKKKSRVTPYGIAALVLMLVLIPFTAWLGSKIFGSRQYYFTSLMTAVEVIGVFALMLEGKRPRARELAVIASLCAIGVAGRAVFFMVPECKPVVAITVVAGAVLGGGRGFTVGAMTMLVSNLIFGQGPWTPWQMVAMGLIGLTAGAVFRLVRVSRVRLCVFGAIAAIIIYGGIMNPVSALMWTDEPSLELLLTYYASGLPLDIIRAASTAVFLAIAGMPIARKLERIREKYEI